MEKHNDEGLALTLDFSAKMTRKFFNRMILDYNHRPFASPEHTEDSPFSLLTKERRAHSTVWQKQCMTARPTLFFLPGKASPHGVISDFKDFS